MRKRKQEKIKAEAFDILFKHFDILPYCIIDNDTYTDEMYFIRIDNKDFKEQTLLLSFLTPDEFLKFEKVVPIIYPMIKEVEKEF